MIYTDKLLINEIRLTEIKKMSKLSRIFYKCLVLLLVNTSECAISQETTVYLKYFVNDCKSIYVVLFM